MCLHILEIFNLIRNSLLSIIKDTKLDSIFKIHINIVKFNFKKSLKNNEDTNSTKRQEIIPFKCLNTL